MRPPTTVDELAVSGSLERTHEPCVPTCAMHATRQGKQIYSPYKLEIMKEQKERRHYIVPRCTVVPVEEDHLLQAASGNAGKIGYGGDGGDAKKWGDEWEEEGASPESLTPNPSPKGEGSDYPSYNAWEE